VGPPCALGAVKANIGHLESGAAMAGLLKTLLQMRHRTLVPSLHAEQLNAEIDFTNAPFRLQRDLMPWPERVLASAGADPVMPLRAGISSFGAGGSNAHMVVEESPLARLPDRRPAAIGPWLFPLSAHRPEVLKALVEKLVAFLRIEDGAEGEPDLADMAFTLQMGREALSERLVVLAHSVDDLVVRLAGWLAAAGTLEDPCLFAGTARPARRKPGSMTDAPIGIPEGASLSDVASHWVQGGVVDWSKLQQTDRPSRRISLPLYPFAGGRHWLAGSPNQELTTMLGLTPSPARADLETESQVLFSARDAVIRDHSVQGQTILPGVGYLDHVLRTVQAAQALSKGQYCRLEQVVWSHPFVLQEGERSLWVQLAPEGDNRAFALRSDKQGPAHAKGLYRLLDREPSNALQALNPEALDQACSLSLDKGAIYDRFAALDIAYGPLFQGLDWIRLGTDEAFSQVSLAEGQALPDRTETVLHPTLADGALQTALLLACQDGTARLPFALERLTLVRPLPARCLVHVTAGIKADCYDITLADEQGAPCLRIEAVVFRERADPLKDMVHLPRWEAKGSAGVGVPASVNAPDQTVVVYGATSAAEPVVQALREAYGADQILELGVDRLAPQLLCDAGAIDQIYVLGGLCEPDVDPLDPDGLAAQEQAGVLGFFRLLKVMQRLDLTRSAITIRIVTHGVAALSPGQPVLPAAASLVGLAKVAAKEFPKLRIACIDLDPKTLMNCRSPADRAEMLRWIQAEQDSQGAPVLIREGTRHVQALLPIALPAGHVGGAQAMPDGVTCLILGGAGGLGLAFSRHLARTRQAALIWLGRRPEDATIRSRIAEVEALGGRVLYCQADATDP
ncbi:MAG: polyketide synthase dehydratase domain-containing protein, partial [Rhodospirillaceae bacterium]